MTCTSDAPSGMATDTMCEVPGVLDRVRQLCQGRELCQLIVDNTTLGNGCEQVFKYMTVNYTCKREFYIFFVLFLYQKMFHVNDIFQFLIEITAH